jgi:hypothetical protein
MSYYTSVRGVIEILPPINWGVIAESPFLPDRARTNDKPVKFRIAEESVTTDEGTLIRRSATALVPVQEDPYGARDIVAEVQSILDEFGSVNGREFSGRFDCSGENDFDLWRLEVHGNRAVEVRPRILWPDGSEGAGL